MSPEAVKLPFASDYMEGAHPALVQRLVETNLERTAGYGTDQYSQAAADKIRAACGTPDAVVYFLVGGTQANALMLSVLLKPWQGVIAAETGHISLHEAGAIEYGGHKVLTLPQVFGKISAGEVEAYLEAFEADGNREHMVAPGAVYISQPTEYGTLYSLAELEELSSVCRAHGQLLYVDGARLAYALASPENDAGLIDIARLADAFYIGGTKCGALFGEAIVVPDPELVPHLFTIIKQRGALLAKGRLLGVQFDTLFEDELYLGIGADAVRFAGQIQDALEDAGIPLLFRSPTNQVFPVFSDELLAAFGEKVDMSFWEHTSQGTVMRLATSWATTEADVDQLLVVIKELAG